MKVCMDIQSAVTQTAGVGRYARTLAETLAPIAAPDELSLFHFDFRGQSDPVDAPGARLRTVRWCPGRLAQKAWTLFGRPTFDAWAGPADLYFFPNFVLPPVSKGKTAVTIHDMSYARFPEFAEDRNRQFLETHLRDTVDRADAILTVSQFSADEIANILGVDRNKIYPVYHGISRHFKPPEEKRISSALTHLNIRQPYLLTVGTVEPRKNIPFLIEMFETLTHFTGKLVIAGMPGWKYEPILDAMRRSRRADDIVYLRYVGNSHLPALYTGAEAFLLASRYEGFGFPPLEAMACGTPVISSDCGSLREILGDGALLMNSFDRDQWAHALWRIVTDLTYRAELTARGQAWVQRYTWENTARKTWDIFRKVAS